MHGFQSSGLISSIRERNKRMLNNPLMSDIKFIVKHSETGEKIAIPAHKYVLSIGSRVFYAMFYGELSEKSDFVELVDADSVSLLELFRYLYCDETHLTANCVLRVMYLAEKYMVSGLIDECAEFLNNDIDADNVFDILKQCEDFQDTDHLKERCWSLVDLQTKQCLRSKAFISTSHASLVELLKRDNLGINELDLFRALLHWAEEKCKSLSFEPSANNIRSVLGEASSLVRFSTISESDFLAHVLPTGVLDFNLSDLVFGTRNSTLLPKTPQEQINAGDFLQPRQRIKPLRCRRLFVDESPRIFAPFQRTNTVGFATDQPICMSGARIILSGTKLIDEYIVVTKLLDSNHSCLSSVTGCYTVEYGGTEGLPGFDVYFADPVLIKASVKYFITIFSSAELDLPQRIGKKDEVTCAGVTFRFPDSTHRQFSEIIFYPLAPLW